MALDTDIALNSLGFAKPPSETRVVVAMSGGVDSSVVAAELATQGYDVVGVTLQLYDHGAALAKKGACCAGIDIHDARRVAEDMGFPHYVLDYENIFRETVIDEFAESYLAGATPVPCIRCNERVKFKDLLATARDLDADCMATGHYIQRIIGPHGPELHAGADPRRDQSYFLFSTTPEQLDFLRFPLGHLASKAETRALAAKHGLIVADKPDSQDICFVPDGNYAALIEKLRPGAGEPGEIVDLAGRVLGTHEGVIHYTIGQRRGLGIGGLTEPLYVVRLDPDRRRVVVGPKDVLGVGMAALPAGIIASGMADHLHRRRDMLREEFRAALEDGQIDLTEGRKIEKLRRELGIGREVAHSIHQEVRSRHARADICTCPNCGHEFRLDKRDH